MERYAMSIRHCYAHVCQFAGMCDTRVFLGVLRMDDESDIEVLIGDVICYRRDSAFAFSPVLSIGEIGGIEVMPFKEKQSVIIRRDEVVSVYREVLE